MFHIKTTIGPSNINRIGLFAAQDVSKDQPIYTPNLDLDLLLSQEQLVKLPLNEQETIKHYGYFDTQKQLWHLSFDDIRFCNHSLDANMTLKDGKLVAKKNILAGEELTQNYAEFEKLRQDLQ